MRSIFTLTLTALSVSIVLSGCKSSSGPSVVAVSPPPKEISVENNKTTDNTSKPQVNAPKPVLSAKPETSKPDEATRPIQPNNSQQGGKDLVQPPAENNLGKISEEDTNTSGENNITDTPKENQGDKDKNEKTENMPPAVATDALKAVNIDSKGSPYRVINLNPGKSVVNASAMQKVYFDSFTSTTVEDSPFNSNDDEKEYNNTLVFDLSNNDKESYFKRLSPRANEVLGIHSGVYEDQRLEGNTQKINYLYVNQPYSSYGALFTDQNDSHLFSVHLSAGQNGENARGEAYAEYGVFSNDSKWNDNLVGDATYTGQAIARIIRHINDEETATLPQFDGDVTLKLHLSENWENSRLSGDIQSKSLGKITLNESKITPASYINSNLRFAEEATVEGQADFEGDYHVDFTGPNLEDAVGSVELESDELKYNAVFGATKSAN